MGPPSSFRPVAPAGQGMTFHPEVMLEDQRRLLRQVGPLATEDGFYLAGGTGVAIHLGHRRSVDLDWFTEAEIHDPLRLAEELRNGGLELQVTSTGKGTLHGMADGTRLSFLSYQYPLLSAPLVWSDYRCRLAPPEDLAAMKLSAIGNRGARKDFVDVYALGRQGFSLRDMLGYYRRKFEVRDMGHVLFALTYFDDAEREAMPEMLWDVDWDDIRSALEDWVRRQAAAPE